MTGAIVLVIILALSIAVIIGVARDAGPPPDEVALSYELAWDRLDFDALWDLSSTELRDGLDRKRFVAVKREAYAARPALRDLGATVVADDVAVKHHHATATTSVRLPDGSEVRNIVRMVRRDNRWQVVTYDLAPTLGAT